MANDANNMINFFKSFKYFDNNVQAEDKEVANDYLDVPPDKMTRNSNPEKALDFQINSILFIKDLNKKINNKTVKKQLSIKIVDDNKVNVDTFISLTNEIISEMKTKGSSTPYNQTYVFVYFLFFLYFMNFRVGQIFLYYIFFEIRKISNTLSDAFQNYIQNAMSYSVVTLNEIVTDLSNNNYNKIKLPNTNVAVIYNPVKIPDKMFMEEFQYKWNDASMTKSSEVTTSSSTPPKNDIADMAEKATKAADEAQQNVTSASKINEEAQANKVQADAEVQNAIKNAENAIVKVNEARKNYDAAKAAQPTTQQTAQPVTQEEQNALKKDLEDAFKNTVKAKLRCEEAAKDLYTTSIAARDAKFKLDAATEIFEKASETNKTLLTLSQTQTQTQQTNPISVSNEKNAYETLVNKYIKTTNNIPVDDIIKTMNELSIGIAKKYNADALKKQTELITPKPNPNTKPSSKPSSNHHHGGKKTYRNYKINSVKAKGHLHKNKRHSMRKYRIHY